jgi:hypothetical protein
MANYTSVIRISLVDESLYDEANWTVWGQQNNFYSGVVFLTPTDLFNSIVVAFEAEWGGDLTYVRTTDATYAYYTFTWVNATPSILYGSPISFSIGIRLQTTEQVVYSAGFCSPCPEVDLTICDECRNITLQACADSYKIVAGLTPFTNYFVTIHDRNNDLYIQEITSDGNGDVTIDATSPEFPAGFWLTESGNKVIIIYSDEALTEIEDITVDTTVYSCVLLNLQYYYTTTT